MIYLQHAIIYILSWVFYQIVFGQQMVNNEALKIYNIAPIALILLFYGMSVGINLTGFALFLDQKGFSKVQIGNILSMELAGNLIIAPFLPKISEYFGLFKVIITALLIRSCCLLMFAESSIISHHMIWLFGFGISGFALFASIQYWGASAASGPNKSMIIGSLNVAFGCGIASGVIFLFLKTDKIVSEVFYISSSFSIVIFLLIFLMRKFIPEKVERIAHVGPSKIIKFAQIPILCGMVANYILVAASNFIALYAMANGVVYADAIIINVYMIAGNILFTIPIGMIIDRYNKIVSLMVILVIAVAAIASIPFVLFSKMLTMVTFLALSGAIGGVYLIGLSMLTDKFRAQNLETANIVMLVMNAIGGFAGVSATGAAIGYWGNNGLILSLFMLIFFFLLFVIYSSNNAE